MSSSDRRTLEADPRTNEDVMLRLSRREREMVVLISQGLGNQEIAETLFLSINSVKTYIRSAYRRLGITSRSQAVIWGIRNEHRLAELAEQDRRLDRRVDAPGLLDRALWMVRDEHPTT
jgi:DNA-binding CsgD family transcriptional regulator